MLLKTLLFNAARQIRKNRSPGYIDHFDATRIAGWAFDPTDRSTPALLSLHIDGRPEMNIIADIPREDVQNAGLGPLHCGFDTALPRRLRDGKAHTLELRLGGDGPVLSGGKLTIPAQSAPPSAAGGSDPDAPDGGQASLLPVSTAEGLVYVDHARGALTGWAIGCNSVSVCFDEGVPQPLVLDREVPGFGSGLRPGFRLAIPETLCDGQPHVAHIFFGNSDDLLDGAPLEFAVTRQLPRIELVGHVGRRVNLQVLAADGTYLPSEDVQFHADGALLGAEQTSTGYTLTLPSDACWLIGAMPDGTVLARFRIDGTTTTSEAPRNLPAHALDPETCDAARAAFAAFCDAPDDQFDPLWYRWAHPDAYGIETPEALFAHYRTTGAAAGTGPNSWFDEGAARRRYPALSEAIDHGDLPCAFALELTLGRGALDTLGRTDGLTPATAQALATGRHVPLLDAEEDTAAKPRPLAPLPTRLPPPAGAQDPAHAIYAAWLARLELSDDQRAEITGDDFAMRRDIAAAALTRRPLVSIIMPSWNRAFTIGEAIQSALEQSYPNWELIICDDASEDRTAEVVRSFDDPRIRYMKFLKSNGAGARNKGLRHARGEYIAYLDSDNIWHPLFLDTMLRQLMSRPGQSIAYSAYLDTEIIGARVVLQNIPRPNFRPIRLSSKNFMDLNTIVHHRRVYDWLGGFDNALPRLQDWDLSLRYTSIFRPIYVNRIGVFYRRNVAWGQVTHLFMGGDAQNTVNEKTRRRLSGDHERLAISWPERGQITVLCGGPIGHQPSLRDTAVAKALAQLAAPMADVDLVELGSEPDATPAPGSLPSGVRHHVVPQDLQRAPGRLSTALGDLLVGQPVLAIGLRGQYLRSIPGLDPALVWRVLPSREGAVLQAQTTSHIQFGLGALPVALPDGDHDAKNLSVLILLPALKGKDREALENKLFAEAKRRGLSLLLPPGGGHTWRQFTTSGPEPLSVAPVTSLPAELGQVSLTASMVPVAELDIFSLSLLNALQGRGVPAAIPPDEGSARATSFSRQWIDARAAYEIQVNDPKWICDKLRKLLADQPGMERLAERSQTVHSIAWHPALVRERLYHALYRMQHDMPQQELINVR